MAPMATDAHAALKRAAAEAAVRAEVRSGMVIGLGSGTTMLFALDELGRRVREEGLRIRGVPTSEQTARIADGCGIPLVDLALEPDVAIDGADEVDPRGNLTKGAGGAMTREKCVAVAARRLVIVVDDSKLVSRLAGAVPIEVLPFAVPLVQRELCRRLPGAEPRLRLQGGTPFVTDSGNQILDVALGAERPAPARLARLLDGVTGVVEHGLFVGMKPAVYVAAPAGVRVRQY